VTKKSNIHKSKPKKRGGAIFGVKKIWDMQSNGYIHEYET